MIRTINSRLSLLALALVLAPAAALAQDEVVYYHTDAIGSVRMVTDATGAVVARYDYMPFGETWPTNPPNTAPDVRQFVGKERDVQTDLDYFGARYYRASSGRFVSVDPVLNFDEALTDPQRWNRYSYATNRPLAMVDPDGRDPRLVGAGIGAAVFASWKAIQNYQTGRPLFENVHVEASKGVLLGLTAGLAAPMLADAGLAVSTSGTIAGPIGEISRIELARALRSGGATVELVTNLTQPPTAGRALSAASGQGAQALASAARSVEIYIRLACPNRLSGYWSEPGLWRSVLR